MSILSKVFGGGVSKVVDSIANGIDGVITTQEEKLELQKELEALMIRDRESARDMYKDDSTLQKWFGLVFLVAYMAMTLAMIYFIFLASKGGAETLNVPEWGVAFLSTLFGAMSTKVSTICDFLFGGSKSTNTEKK